MSVGESLWRYLPRGAYAEVPGRTRREAIAALFATLDAKPGRRRTPAATAFRVVRAHQIGPRWWGLRYKRAGRSAAKEGGV